MDRNAISWISPIGFAALAAVIPLLLVTVHHAVRLRRIRLIDVLSRSFDHDEEGKQSFQKIPSFEFVKSKYSVDLGACPDGIDKTAFENLDLRNEGVARYLEGLRWFHLASSRRILYASVPYSLLTSFSIFIVLFPLLLSGAQTHVLNLLPQSLLTVGATELREPAYHQGAVTIGAAAFLGAYLYTLRTLVRGVIAFDLSQGTMLRVAIHVVVSIIGAVTIWRGFAIMGGQTGVFAAALQTGLSMNRDTTLAGTWLLLAFLIGYVQDLWLDLLLSKVQTAVKFIKRSDARFYKHTNSIPLDLIDGIDFFTKFRLEESTIYEVQNLATYNPLMLHVETPFGVYETIDWVAQAQLCVIVGPERFLLLREFNIRTIFDLEQAVLDPRTSAQLIRFVGSILIMQTQTSRDILRITKTTYVGIGKPPQIGLESGKFDEYVTHLFSEMTEPEQETVRHFVRVMVDDLHVKRLRQIWLAIAERLDYRG